MDNADIIKIFRLLFFIIEKVEYSGSTDLFKKRTEFTHRNFLVSVLKILIDFSLSFTLEIELQNTHFFCPSLRKSAGIWCLFFKRYHIKNNLLIL